jgi:hypothetical protein
MPTSPGLVVASFFDVDVHLGVLTNASNEGWWDG